MKGVVLLDGEIAESQGPRSFGERNSAARLEPMQGIVDQPDGGERNLENLGHDLNQIFVKAFSRGIQDLQFFELLQALKVLRAHEAFAFFCARSATRNFQSSRSRDRSCM